MKCQKNGDIPQTKTLEIEKFIATNLTDFAVNLYTCYTSHVSWIIVQ